MLETTTLDRDAPKWADALTKEQYDRVRSLQWDNPHTRRLRQLTGDERLMVAWDPIGGTTDPLGQVPPGRWAVARLCRRTVVSHFGEKLCHDFEWVPVIVGHLEDGTGRTPVPMRPDDPRVPDMVRRADMWKRDPVAEHLEREAAKRRARAQRHDDYRQRVKDLWQPFVRWADDRGVVPRRAVASTPRSFLSDAAKAG